MTDPKAFLTELFDIAVANADPMAVLKAHLPQRPKGRFVVIGAGKASARMAEAVEAHYGPCEGFVITRYGYARPCQQIEIVQAAHPVPDATGATATQSLLNRVSDLTPDDFVLALISGGGSALLCAPIDGITLADKIAVNAALLSSGAPISEMNTLRKHLSRVKGGKLAAAIHPARLLTLMISDVPVDDPAMIASGPTVGDHSTPQEVLAIAHKWNIPLPKAAVAALGSGGDTVAPDDPRLARCETRIVAAPSHSLAAAAQQAREAGLEVRVLGDALEGEARELGAAQAREAMQLQSRMRPGARPILLLSGGECTVTRRGDGIGGPNAEFTLAAALVLNGCAGIHVLACDTDGVDGAAEVAGAYAGPDCLDKANQQGCDPRAALSTNDAHGFFEALNDQIISGPTLTNVNDFRAILVQAE
ncbi:MAG: glycerate kinase [Pelagimonas sp.]|jgi:hydroxypyruvate reductase|nr:glycerate kinase [Pelagimonas sp.]